MSEQAISKLSALLAGEIFPGLLAAGAGFHARNGIGTYESFLLQGGLRPPYSIPASDARQHTRFQAACSQKARTIVRGLERANALDGPLRSDVLSGPFEIHRVVGSRNDPWGGWWFSDAVYRGAWEECARRGAQILSEADRQRKLRELLRRRLAIRVDWNEIDRIESMKVLRGRLPAVFGRGRRQPSWTPDPLERSAPPDLRGGEEQIWLPWSAFVILSTTSLV